MRTDLLIRRLRTLHCGGELIGVSQIRSRLSSFGVDLVYFIGIIFIGVLGFGFSLSSRCLLCTEHLILQLRIVYIQYITYFCKFP